MSESRPRRSTGPRFNYYTSYLIGADPEEINRTRVEELRLHAHQLGFQSLFDAILVEAQDPSQICPFVEAGGIASLYSHYRKYRKLRTDVDPIEVRRSICAPAVEIFSQEWKALTGSTTDFKHPLTQFSPEYIAAFKFDAIYTQMRELAPCLLDFLDKIAPISSPVVPKSKSKEAQVKEERLRQRAQRRHIVVALSVLGHQTSQQFNVIQGPVGYFLFGSKVCKRVIKVLNKLGICPSYSNLLKAIRANASAIRDRLGKLCYHGEAIWVSYDNMTFLANVRDWRLFNSSEFKVWAAGYAVKPPASRARPMFTDADVDYSQSKHITLHDFLPSQENRTQIRSANLYNIWATLRNYAKSKKLTLPKLAYPMPTILQLNHLERSEIIPLPTYDLNEGIINETIKIIEAVASSIGLSKKQIKKNRILFKGDLATVYQNRRAVRRQRRCSPDKRLNFVETSMGLFHLQIHVLSMLFQAHFGDADDRFSITRWITELRRDTRNIWSKDNRTVKKFTACLDLFDHILDGYIIAALSTYYDYDSVDQFMEGMAIMSPETLDRGIQHLADQMSNFGEVTGRRKTLVEERDSEHENIILFMQQGLVLRTFGIAMRRGDSGMVLQCLSYFTVWFQATNRYNYANETIHLTACIKRLWSPEMCQYWMENCLINPSGKKEGWMACDYLGEYVVRENKSMLPNNVNPSNSDFLRNSISPQILTFRDSRKTMTEECDLAYTSSHSTSVDASVDIRHVANLALQEHICQHQDGRNTGFQAVDLHGNGIKQLSTMKRIVAYVAKIEKNNAFTEQNPMEEIEDRHDDHLPDDRDGDDEWLDVGWDEDEDEGVDVDVDFE